ncbi:dTDP-glucose 4,6-dehydratase [Bryobacter aggregatus]|uniref:dTDP-glucose 4,6-dehydratase n=1 Tax=Bryobacter aggregatus TaxID=360054 RepID=UPI0004E28A97|nr:dTDP-glucose 4,6-dehydratase [Bryobacter aggregatus]
MKILVTGGAGFIGSAFIRLTMDAHPEFSVVNLDKLTYAGNLENLKTIEGNPRYRFVRADVCDAAAVDAAFVEHRPDAVVHFAAESHVDRSILSPEPVVSTNFMGSFQILEAAKRHRIGRYVHVSTDEVYGSIPEPLDADESYPLIASSPYSSSKAGSDLLALSYAKTFGFPVMVTRASNNYGPYQFPEKLIPLMISNALEDQALPIYGDGMQVRDWLYVDDHCRAIHAVLAKGEPGEVYNVGGSRALANLEVVHRILKITGKPESLMKTVKDRPGHDRRYAITSEKLEKTTGWRAEMDFELGLQSTIEWYVQNRDWVARVKSGSYRDYYERNYTQR